MPFLATVTVLIHEDKESKVCESIEDIMRKHARGFGGNVVDWSIGRIAEVSELKTSIETESYEKGNAFKDWVLFSPSAMLRGEGCGFYSSEYGWVTLDLATKYEVPSDRPASADEDAVWMIAPYGLNFYRALLVEFPDDPALDPPPIAFECWAEDEDHAQEQTLSAYPESKVVEVTPLGG